MKLEAILGFYVFISIALTFMLSDYLSLGVMTNRSSIDKRFPIENIRSTKPYISSEGKPSAFDLNTLGYRKTNFYHSLLYIMVRQQSAYEIRELQEVL